METALGAAAGEERTHRLSPPQVLETPTIQQVSPKPVEEDLHFKPGERLGPYIVERFLAGGGFASVYQVIEPGSTGRRAAVKVLSKELTQLPVMIERFQREVQAILAINHPDIVQIYSVGQLDDGRPYYVMELLDGVSLTVMIRERRQISPGEALEIMAPLCRALAATHEAGIVHRDVKSSNILVSQRDGRPVATLVDFGIAKILTDDGGPGLTAQGELLGTATTMAPEQIAGAKVDARADIYAVGVVLYQMLTGRSPFPGKSSMEVLRRHLENEARPPSSWVPVSPEIDAVVAKCLEKRPERRFATAHELLAALQQAVHGAAVPSQGTTGEAVAVYFEVTMPPEVEQAMDDEVMMDLGNVLSDFESFLTQCNFVLPLKTDRAVLGISPAGLKVDSLREQTRAWLKQQLRREGADARLKLCLYAHEGSVERNSAEPTRIDGPLMAIEQWVPRQRLEGSWLVVSPEKSQEL